MSAAPTRRAMLGAIALAPIATAAVAVPSIPATTDRSAWDRALAEVKRLKAIMDVADQKADVLIGRMSSGFPQAAMERVSSNHADCALIAITTFDEAKALAKAERDCGSDHARLVTAKSDIQSVREWQAVAAAIHGGPEYQQACDVLEAACDSYCDAAHDLLMLPAPDIAAVSWKLDYLFGDDKESSSCWDTELLHVVMADVRRLAGEGR